MTNVTHSRLVRMSIKKVDGPQDHHRFIDEAGDMTFHSGKRGRKSSSIGMDGVSRCFMIGLVHVKSPLDDARATIDGFCEEINSSKFFQSFPASKREQRRDGTASTRMPAKILRNYAMNSSNSWRRRSTSPHE